MVLVQVQYFTTGTRYSLAILQQCSKRVKSLKLSHKALKANSYVC